MRLVVDATALHDLESIGAWIAKDSPQAARRVLVSIFRTMEQLQHFPLLSRPGRVRSTRERVVAGTPYIVVFEVLERQQTVVIIAVAHYRRNQ